MMNHSLTPEDIELFVESSCNSAVAALDALRYAGPFTSDQKQRLINAVAKSPTQASRALQVLAWLDRKQEALLKLAS